MIALPIAEYYRKQGWEIHWPICREFVSHMYRVAPQIIWHPVTTDSTGYYFYDEPMRVLLEVGCDEIIPLYQALTNHPEFSQQNYFQHTKFDQYKYIRAEVPFYYKWQLKDCITRDRDREQALLEVIQDKLGGANEPYILVHVTGSTHRAEFNTEIIPKDIPAVEITEATDSVWDWCLALDQAHAVILVDSVMANIVDQLALNSDDGRYFIPRSHIGLTPVLGQHWTWIDNLQLPTASRTIA